MSMSKIIELSNESFEGNFLFEIKENLTQKEIESLLEDYKKTIEVDSDYNTSFFLDFLKDKGLEVRHLLPDYTIYF